jgi:hypothetical protein
LLIVNYQSDKVPVSEVLPDFQKLPEQFAKLHADGIITEEEFHYLVQLSKERFQFMYGDLWFRVHFGPTSVWRRPSPAEPF